MIRFAFWKGGSGSNLEKGLAVKNNAVNDETIWDKKKKKKKKEKQNSVVSKQSFPLASAFRPQQPPVFSVSMDSPLRNISYE